MKKKKNFVLFWLLAFALLILFPTYTQAAIRTTKLQDGFRLSGKGSYYSGGTGEYVQFLNYQTPSGGMMDYQYSVSMTFSSPEEVPDDIIIELDDSIFHLYPQSDTVFANNGSISIEGELAVLEISCFYFNNQPDVDTIDFQFDLTAKENCKNIETSIFGPTSGYEVTNQQFTFTVDDPYLTGSLKASMFDASISNTSVAKITNSTLDLATASMIYDVTFLKPGSADLTVKYQGQTTSASFTVLKTVLTIPDDITLKVGQTAWISSYVSKTGGGKLTIKKVRSSNKKVLAAGGGFLEAKRTGTAKITAVFNGKKKVISCTVYKKVPKPTVKQLKVKAVGYKYYPSSRKLYIQTRFTNNSARTITKVKLRYDMELSETVTKTKTFNVNIKPKKTKTLNIYVGNLIDRPYKTRVKCLKFWYK